MAKYASKQVRTINRRSVRNVISTRESQRELVDALAALRTIVGAR